MRAILLAVFIASLGASAAYAEDAALPPGKPAGVNNAALIRNPYFYVVFGLGLVGAGIAIAGSSGHSTITTSTTTATATSP